MARIREMEVVYKEREATVDDIANGYLKECRTAKQRARMFKHIVEDDRENVWGLFLDSRNRVLALQKITNGTNGQVALHGREVFRLACGCDAPKVILAHNHTGGGEIEFSPQDIATTQKLFFAGQIMGLHIADHIVLTRDVADGQIKYRTMFYNRSGTIGETEEPEPNEKTRAETEELTIEETAGTEEGERE